MTEAKKNHLRVNRPARFNYLFRGGKHKINRSPWDGLYHWTKERTINVLMYDSKSGYYAPVEHDVSNNWDYQWAVKDKV